MKTKRKCKIDLPLFFGETKVKAVLGLGMMLAFILSANLIVPGITSAGIVNITVSGGSGGYMTDSGQPSEAGDGWVTFTVDPGDSPMDSIQFKHNGYIGTPASYSTGTSISGTLSVLAGTGLPLGSGGSAAFYGIDMSANGLRLEAGDGGPGAHSGGAATATLGAVYGAVRIVAGNTAEGNGKGGDALVSIDQIINTSGASGITLSGSSGDAVLNLDSGDLAGGVAVSTARLAGGGTSEGIAKLVVAQDLRTSYLGVTSGENAGTSSVTIGGDLGIHNNSSGIAVTGHDQATTLTVAGEIVNLGYTHITAGGEGAASITAASLTGTNRVYLLSQGTGGASLDIKGTITNTSGLGFQIGNHLGQGQTSVRAGSIEAANMTVGSGGVENASSTVSTTSGGIKLVGTSGNIAVTAYHGKALVESAGDIEATGSISTHIISVSGVDGKGAALVKAKGNISTGFDITATSGKSEDSESGVTAEGDISVRILSVTAEGGQANVEAGGSIVTGGNVSLTSNGGKASITAGKAFDASNGILTIAGRSGEAILASGEGGVKAGTLTMIAGTTNGSRSVLTTPGTVELGKLTTSLSGVSLGSMEINAGSLKIGAASTSTELRSTGSGGLKITVTGDMSVDSANLIVGSSGGAEKGIVEIRAGSLTAKSFTVYGSDFAKSLVSTTGILKTENFGATARGEALEILAGEVDITASAPVTLKSTGAGGLTFTSAGAFNTHAQNLNIGTASDLGSTLVSASGLEAGQVLLTGGKAQDEVAGLYVGTGDMNIAGLTLNATGATKVEAITTGILTSAGDMVVTGAGSGGAELEAGTIQAAGGKLTVGSSGGRDLGLSTVSVNGQSQSSIGTIALYGGSGGINSINFTGGSLETANLIINNTHGRTSFFAKELFVTGQTSLNLTGTSAGDVIFSDVKLGDGTTSGHLTGYSDETASIESISVTGVGNTLASGNSGLDLSDRIVSFTPNGQNASVTPMLTVNTAGAVLVGASDIRINLQDRGEAVQGIALVHVENGGTLTGADYAWALYIDGEHYNIGRSAAEFDVVMDADEKSLLLKSINAAQNTILTWTGAVDNTWKPGIADWSGMIDGIHVNQFLGGDSVVFDADSATPGIVTIDASGVEIGAMTVKGKGDWTFIGGSIQGVGGLVKEDSGILTLSGANAYTGGTVISGGTLFAENPHALGSGMVRVDDSGLLNLAFNGEFTNAIKGTGMVEVSGAVSFNQESAPIDLAVTGILSGTSRLNKVLVKTGAAISPGNSIGTLSVESLTFEAGSFYDVEVDPADTAMNDQLVVENTATLAGTVRHTGLLEGAGKYSPLGTWTILKAGDIAGKFDDVVSDFTFLEASLLYGAKDVQLQLSRNSLDFMDFAVSSNQIAVAAGLEAIGKSGSGAGMDVYNTVLTMNVNTDLPSSFDILSGEIYAGLQGTLMESDRSFGEKQRIRLSGQGTGVSAGELAPGMNFWAGVDRQKNTVDRTSNTGKSELSGWGTSFGVERALSAWTLGGAFRYGDSEYKINDRASKADLDSFNFGLYAGRPLGCNFNIKFGAGYGLHQVDSKRRVGFMAQRLSADYDIHTIQAFGEIGWLKHFDAFTLEPYAGISWNFSKNDSFTEKGGSAALHVKSEENDNFTSNLGVRGQYRPTDKLAIGAHLDYQHLFGDKDPVSRFAFAGSHCFSIEGASMNRDSVGVGMDLNFELKENLSIRAGYLGRFGEDSDSHAGFLNLEFSF